MPAVNGEPDVPFDADIRFNMEANLARTLGGQMKLGDFLKALCQKLDADPGVADTDFESLFTP